MGDDSGDKGRAAFDDVVLRFSSFQRIFGMGDGQGQIAVSEGRRGADAAPGGVTPTFRSAAFFLRLSNAFEVGCARIEGIEIRHVVRRAGGDERQFDAGGGRGGNGGQRVRIYNRGFRRVRRRCGQQKVVYQFICP